jgi:hypothetical protein
MQKRMGLGGMNVTRKDTGISSVEVVKDDDGGSYVVIGIENAFLGFPDAKDGYVSGRSVEHVQVALSRVSAEMLVERLEEKLCGRAQEVRTRFHERVATLLDEASEKLNEKELAKFRLLVSEGVEEHLRSLCPVGRADREPVRESRRNRLHYNSCRVRTGT